MIAKTLISRLETNYSIFNNEFNIGFHTPKKDLCETCVAFNNAIGDAKENLRGESSRKRTFKA